MQSEDRYSSERTFLYFIESLVEIRQGSDYDDFYLISKEEVEEQYNNAVKFIEVVEKYLIEKYNEC